MKKLLLLNIAVLSLVIGCTPVPQPVTLNTNTVTNQQPAVPVPSASTTQPIPTVKPKPEPAPVPTKPAILGPNAPVPASVLLAVPFGTQAPFSNWDALHEEACEEASMVMASQFIAKKPITPHVMEQGILDVVKWEGNNGYPVDVTADEVVRILKNYFSVSSHVMTDVSVDGLKKTLAAGHMILVPAAGRELGNPNFKAPGPIYHMLVLRGYDDAKKQFITNDPGTRNGEEYRYNYQTLINAIHDWDHAKADGGMTDAEMDQGRKVVIVVD